MLSFSRILTVLMIFTVTVEVRGIDSNRASSDSILIGKTGAPSWDITPLPDGDGFRISIVCPGMKLVREGDGYAVRIPGQVVAREAGSPDIPRLARLISVAPGMYPVLSLQGMDPTNITGIVVIPTVRYQVKEAGGGLRSLEPSRQPDAGIYATDDFWPANPGHIEQALIGTQNVVRVECVPVQYNPIGKSIRFFGRVEGVLRFNKLSNAASSP